MTVVDMVLKAVYIGIHTVQLAPISGNQWGWSVATSEIVSEDLLGTFTKHGEQAAGSKGLVTESLYISLCAATQCFPVGVCCRMLSLARTGSQVQVFSRTSVALFSCDVTIVGGGPTGVCAGAILQHL